MSLFLVKTLGRFFALWPEWALAMLCRGLGVLLLLTTRGDVIRRNLYHAFPDRPMAWHRRIARENAARLFEMGLYLLCSPYLSERRHQQIMRPAESFREIAATLKNTPAILLVPHLTMMETQIRVRLYAPEIPEIAVFYRPFNNPRIDQWILETRSRFGTKPISRKEGLAQARQTLRRKGWVGILADHNAAFVGTLDLFFDRVVSATELPGLLAQKHQAKVVVCIARRKAFWRAGMEFIQLPGEPGPSATMQAFHRWFEDALREDDALCADWLWIHKRWKTQHETHRRLRIEQKKSLLPAQPPRKTPFVIRLPNWLGDVVMLLPLLRALRESRPDVHFTLVGKGGFRPLLEGWGLAEDYLALPAKGWGYFQPFRQLRQKWPETWLLFTNSLRGDREAALSRCPQRFGMIRPGKPRPLLTDSWEMPSDLDESQVHQTEVWRQFLQHFGLEKAPQTTPLPLPEGARLPAKLESLAGDSKASPAPIIGMICGTENNPGKRWPIPSWRELIGGLQEDSPETSIVLFGTPSDRTITEQVMDAGQRSTDQGGNIINLAGETTLPEFCAALQACQVVITNDTGGMHLANALGVPVIGLFGPTNPVRTGPVFEAPRIILQPPACPATGGLPMEAITVEAVRRALFPFLTG